MVGTGTAPTMALDHVQLGGRAVALLAAILRRLEDVGHGRRRGLGQRARPAGQRRVGGVDLSKYASIHTVSTYVSKLVSEYASTQVSR